MFKQLIFLPQALAICGDAVEAEFEAWLKGRGITEEDCPKNLNTTLAKICTSFKDKKKTCGDYNFGGDDTWHAPFPHLRANAGKGFEEDNLPIPK